MWSTQIYPGIVSKTKIGTVAKTLFIAFLLLLLLLLKRTLFPAPNHEECWIWNCHCLIRGLTSLWRPLGSRWCQRSHSRDWRKQRKQRCQQHDWSWQAELREAQDRSQAGEVEQSYLSALIWQLLFPSPSLGRTNISLCQRLWPRGLAYNTIWKHKPLLRSLSQKVEEIPASGGDVVAGNWVSEQALANRKGVGAGRSERERRHGIE